MLEPAPITDDALRATVATRWGIVARSLRFLPIGNDARTFVYRLEATDGGDYFLKLRRGPADGPSLTVPRYLADRGVPNIMAALRTVTGALWVELEGFALALYPYVVGVTGTDAGMEARHWVTYGAALRQIHETVLSEAVAATMRRETFVPDPADVLVRLDAHVAGRSPADPAEAEAAAFWRGRRDAIRGLAARAAGLGRQVRERALPSVLCHADIHTYNLMLDGADRLWIVDWDETVLAPRERDLMFVVGGISAQLVGAREEAWFFDGYGAWTPDPLALTYYRHAWAVSDIGAYGEQIFLMPDVGVANKRAAVAGLRRCFEPGEIVAIASPETPHP